MRAVTGWLAPILIGLVLVVLLHAFVVQTYSIPSGSMEPTLQVGDRIAVNKLSYDFHRVHRGDIIVFRRPPAEHCQAGVTFADLVKRVIGLPGETISSSNGQVLINGRPLAEPWLPPNDPLGKPIAPITLPPHEYYVLGDNRADSCDSRYWGPVARNLIVGKVDLRFWPLSRFHLF